MELTTVDPLGVFYLVALDADWKLRPQNIMARGAFRPRPTITMHTAYAANASAGTFGAYSIASRNFELQQRVTADLHSAICTSLGSVTLNEINSKHQFGTGSLTPLDLVTELKTNNVRHYHQAGNRRYSSSHLSSSCALPRFPRFLQQHTP